MRRLAALSGVLVFGALAAAWYFSGGEDRAPPEAEPSVLRVSLASEPGAQPDSGPPRRFFTSGLQTTVQDTVGLDERTAIYALQDGGFRVRVMTHKVTSGSQDGIVVQQLPRGGVTRRVGWIVTIVVGRLR